MTGARIFVTVLFVMLAASFLASTAILINEFKEADWPSMVVAHSHLFFYFPLFGILALAAFYLPAVVFTDFYWHSLPYGKLRFLAGALVLAGLSIYVAHRLDGAPRALWEISPKLLLEDRGEPGGCLTSGTCQRVPILSALAELRMAAQERHGLSKFGRSCLVDKMLELPDEMDKERQCFPAGRKLKGIDCCQAQDQFRRNMSQLYADPANRSRSANFDRLFMPLKIFFILVVVVIAALLARWRGQIDEHYGSLVPPIERGVIIGAFAMLFWPIMDYGYQETANALFGRFHGAQLRYSLIIVPWALLLLFYFLRRLGKKGEMVGQIAGMVTAGVAVLRYEDLNDWAVRLLGIGTNNWILGVLAALAVIGFVALFKPIRGTSGPLGSPST